MSNTLCPKCGQPQYIMSTTRISQGLDVDIQVSHGDFTYMAVNGPEKWENERFVHVLFALKISETRKEVCIDDTDHVVRVIIRTS